MNNDSVKKEMLRHLMATLAYRGGKTALNAPEEFRDFKINEQTRTPGEILAHIGDLLDWASRLAKGRKGGLNSVPLTWELETERFFSTLKDFDSYLASDSPIEVPVEKLIQGPIADAFTHVGQIAMLRRLAGKHVRGENYFKAEIVIGRVGAEQSDVRFEFD
jgi:hypothetical protein